MFHSASWLTLAEPVLWSLGLGPLSASPQILHTNTPLAAPRLYNYQVLASGHYQNIYLGLEASSHPMLCKASELQGPDQALPKLKQTAKPDFSTQYKHPRAP